MENIPENPSQKSPKRRGTSFEPATAIAFGQVIRAERVRQSIAQDQFALDAHVDRSYYGKLERGERQPSLALIIKIATCLGIPASELVEKTEDILKNSFRY